MSEESTNSSHGKNIGEIPVSLGTKLAYGCGDVACNVVIGITFGLLSLFYTDYAGIPFAALGIIMLISRIFDGTSDVIMGFIVDKTHSRWGKARPWLLWTSVPYVISAIALFTIPKTTEWLTLVYVFVTYNFCTTICYTAINVPYGALSTMMTRSSYERGMLSIFRMAMAPLGRILVVSLTIPVVKWLGNDQAAWIKAMTLWSVVAFALLIVCFRKCEEHVAIPAEQKKGSVTIGKNLKALASNQYFWATLVLWTLTVVHMTVSGTVMPYYCKYIFGNDTWMYSYLYLSETLLLVIGALLCPLFLRRFGKRNLALAGCIVAVIAQAVFFLDPRSYALAISTTLIRALGQAPLYALLFGMMGDTVEFGQWKTRVRQASLVFGAGSLGFKLGVGLASAAMGALLHSSGYVSSLVGGAEQPESALQMIMYIYLYGTLLIWLAAAVVLAFYRLDKIYPKIMEDLKEREANGEL
jgi:GPH family glycoside/pentoside/hexuronide:cation symporter